MDKKKFLFVSLDGLIADIAWQVVKEGHEALLWIPIAPVMGRGRRRPSGLGAESHDLRAERDAAPVG
jgi:hypothetical protein